MIFILIMWNLLRVMLHNIPFHLTKSLYNVYAAKFAWICGVVAFVKYHIMISSLGNLNFNLNL